MHQHSLFYPKPATYPKTFRGGYEFPNVTECVYANKKKGAQKYVHWEWYHPEMNTKDNM